MPKSLYIGTLGPRSGKSLVLLGVLEMLSRRVEKLGLFRPVIRSPDPPDNDIELARTRYDIELPYESMYALTREQVRRRLAEGRHGTLLKDVFDRYKALQRSCDFVVCEGTDFTDVGSALEFDFNARLANHLGAPVLIVASGRDRATHDLVAFVRASREAFREEGCSVAATLVNRVDPDAVDDVTRALRDGWPHEDPTYVLPEEPLLGKPTVSELVSALDGQLLHGDETVLNREVRDYRVAAMHLPNFLDHVGEGSLVIAPGDRADIILGCVAAALSEHYPAISGLVLTGGLEPAPQIRRLLEGLRKWTVPICSVETDTYETAIAVGAVPALITPGNERKIAAALGLFASHVDAEALERRIDVSRSARVTPMMFEYELLERAEADRQHIVLPEGTDERILRAAEILLRRNAAELTLLGDEREIRDEIASLGLDLEQAAIQDPTASPWLDDFAETYYELRKHRGVSEAAARDTLTDVSYFGTMMVYKGLADGMVSGAAHTTAHTIRPSFEIIRTVPGCSIVSSVFLMCLEDRVLVYGDCAVNPEPDPEQLADIAASSAATARMFGIEPRVAMLSYSTGESGSGEEVEKVREATRIARERHPELEIEGPIQYDAAIDAGVARKKLPGSAVAGRATVFIFPDLNTGNNTYKAVQRSANAVAIGPVLQGLKKPVNDLSRGCTMTDIVNTVAITAIQAQAIEAAP
jgi:phosphate acetyltransferase